ncbi:MAG: Rieske 2Fe-2S domain-containing protein [Verrucomicrobia bacterium]|nr:Rieske 2Fe-2S domain-containing protein [Verrucomicrobiota bacterium]
MATNESESHPPVHPEKKSYSTRRDFLVQVGAVLNAIAGFMIGLPLVGFILSSLIKSTPPVWFSLGPVSNFQEGAMRMAVYENPYRREADGQTARLTCWVHRISGDQFKVFAANCTHLGCPVRWFEESQLFLCPCHGGAFYADGEHAAGPPPRGLYVYEHKIVNGELQVKAGVLPTLAFPV